MKKKLYLHILCAAAALSAAPACTGLFEEYNSDKYGATDEELQRDGYIVRSALTGIASGIISLDVNTTQFTECLLGGPMAGYMADANQGFSNTISNYNPTDHWTNQFMENEHLIPAIYSNYRQLQRITSDPVILAVGDVIKVAGMHRVTDTYGPIPYSQIKEDGKIQVPFDSQQQVYEKMLEELSNAIDVLTRNRTNNFSPDADAIFGGHVEKWIRYANSLKLRLAMRISYAEPELARKCAEEVAAHPIGTMASTDDIACLSTFSRNPINVAVKYNMAQHDDGSQCITGGDSHAAADIICYMNGYNDPRRAAYFTPSEWTGFEYVGLRHGIVIPDHGSIGHKYSGVKIDDKTPIVLMNAAEAAFCKAEAVAVFGWEMGGTAKEFYEEGVRLSFAQWGISGADSYLANTTNTPANYNDPAGTNSYPGGLSTLSVAWDENATVEEKQERIMIQKWIANWLLGNESWCDIRRTGYPHILPATDEGNKSNGAVDPFLGARRMKYPTAEYTRNTENINQAVQNLLGGPDEMSTRLWFDCKNK